MTINTKYDCGDMVFYMISGRVETTPINAIKVNYQYAENGSLQIRYRVKGTGEDSIKNQYWIIEEKLFPSKEALINSL